MTAAFALVSPSLPCQCLGNLLHLLHCCSVPASERFESKRDEIDTLSLTVISCSSHFPVKGKAETVSGGDGSLGHRGLLQRVDDGDVQSRVATSRPVGEEDVRGAAVVAGKKKTPLFLGIEHGTRSHLENMVSKVIVSGNPLAPETAAKSMITKLVTWVVASRAGPGFPIYLTTKTVFNCKDKLDGLEVQAKGW